MEVEIIIYFGVAVLIGVLILGFAKEWDFTKESQDLANFYYDEESGQEFKKETTMDFAVSAYKYYESCNYSTLENTEMHYVYSDDKDITELNSSILFGYYLDLQWCGTIQSQNHSCGWREDVAMNSTMLPDIVRLSCINGTMYISPLS